MKYTECANGHVYDSDQYAACPYCNHAGMEIQFGPGEGGKTVAPGACRKREELSNRTVAVFQQKYGLDPVVGWLVCIEGPDRGMDFRLRARINTIGRGESNDVRVKGDKTISSHAHAKIAYDARHNNFQLLPGEGANINYLNDQPVYTPVPLRAYDRVDLGESRFLFVPLCGERFQWAAVSKEQE